MQCCADQKLKYPLIYHAKHTRQIKNVHCFSKHFHTGNSSSPLLSLVTSTSEISHQPVHTYTTHIYDKGVDRTGRQGIEEKYSMT